MIQREKENESCTFKPNLQRASSDFELCKFDPDRIRLTSQQRIGPFVPDTIDNKTVSQTRVNEVHDRLLKWGDQQKKNKSIMEQYNQAIKHQ